MHVIITRSFKKTVKKLHKTQKQDVDKAVLEIMKNPEIGQLKSGDLNHIRIYKFKMVKQEMLLAYTYEDEIITLTLLALGAHENFYRDLKR